ncbi:MAG: hypothetical protein EPN23_02365 [Verrucomicrobia bacterium]|nr:MAG: hypothetical protein EPN23_02365 [Verrucomicrobiota bacterium]
MKTIIRSVCVVLAVAALSGCGVPKEEHQKLQEKCAGLEQQLGRAQQDIQALQNALQQKEAEAAGRVQEADQRVQAMMLVLKKKQQELDAKGGKATSAKVGTTTKKPAAKSTKKPAGH